MEELPFKVEYARSTQSTCRACRAKISGGELRIARVFPSALFDGNQSNWFHAHCFFDVNRPQHDGEFEGFDCIRITDQNYIQSEIGEFLVVSLVLNENAHRPLQNCG